MEALMAPPWPGLCALCTQSSSTRHASAESAGRFDGQRLVEFGVGVGDAKGAVAQERPGGVQAHLAANDTC